MDQIVQSSVMSTSDPDAGSHSGQPSLGTLLSPALRRRLSELNRAYVELSVEWLPEADARLLEAERAARVVRMDEAARQRLADCPLALFELRIAEALATPLAGGAGVADHGGAALARRAAGDGSLLPFAVFYAWHVATTSPLSALLMLGLQGAELRLLLEVPPARLALLAGSPALLRPRWSGNAAFWDTLLEGAETGSEALLRRAHCLGVQLLSEAVAPASAPDVDAARAPSTRLR